ncbi:MAG: ABC transporter permease [Solirubrobacteraceae bacterium]
MTDAAEVLIVRPRRAGARARLRELRERRSLIGFFGREMVEKRYARTLLGWIWIPLRPILDIASRLFIFGGVLGLGSEGVPYLLYIIVVLGGWQLFGSTAYWATRSLEINRSVLKRAYVPRLAVVCASIIPSGLDYLIYLGLGVLAVAGYLIADSTTYLVLGPDTLLALGGLLLLLTTAVGIGLFTSVYATHYRDVRFSLNYVLGFWQYATPVVYPLSQVPDGLRTAVLLNPLTAPIEMVKRGVFGVGELESLAFVSTGIFLLVTVIGGTLFFLKSESMAVDNL